MKFTEKICLLLPILFLIMSCSKDTNNVPPIENNLPCEIEGENPNLSPVCSFNPKYNPDKEFPIMGYINGQPFSSDDFNFIWSDGEISKSPYRGITYNQLPIELKITEIGTDCILTLVLEKSYWN